MAWESPEDVMPWVGLYVAVASLICTLAMAADVVRSFWQWKLWFPNKFFTLNASTITIMAIALKLPVDLTTKMDEAEAHIAKLTGFHFLLTMLANFLPSLGLMNDGELLMNIIALGILVTTIMVNIWIQVTLVFKLFIFDLLILCFPFIWPFSVALTVSASRKKLEQRYKESQQMVSSHQEKMFSSKDLTRYVKRYWMMTETRNPQFVIACSPVSSAFGVICAYLALDSTSYFLIRIGEKKITSEYKWSIKIIFIIQSLGIVVGCIAPVFRCITSIGHYNLSKKWSKNQLNVFQVEKHWIQTLQQWKRSHVHSYIPGGRHCKMVFHADHGIKKLFLNFCIILHIMVLVICKTISLAPKTFFIIISCCWYFFKLVLKRIKKITEASNSNLNSEIEEYTRYVVQIEEEAKLSNRILRNTLHSIIQLLNKSEKEEPCNLMMLLEKSSGFNGITEFDNDQTPPLYSEETHYCWSLVIVTLTSIVIALPNIENDHFEGLLSSIGEGLQIVRHVEECLDTNGNSVKARKAARHGWTEIKVYRTWLRIKLQHKTCKGKNSKEILRWLGDEAAKIVIQFKSSKMASIDQSPYKFLLAGSMYRISQTVLLHCNEQEKLSNDKQVFEWISTMIADILSACFTNLPRVIKMKCHHHAIEKRGDNIRTAAQLLGRSKKILKILKTRQLPNIDPDSMAYINNWRELNMSRTPISGNISYGGALIAGTTSSPSSSSESIIVTIM